MKSNVYVDGFNLYYGAVKDTKSRWLNLQRLFELLRPDDEIQTIWYFTAEVAGGRHARQLSYLSALATLPKVEIVLGRFKLKNVQCRVPQCDFKGARFFRTPEEKRTDVQIALRIAEDLFQNACDQFILVSGDSDLVPAVRLAKRIAPQKRFVVYIPAQDERRGAALELRGAADKARILPNELVRKCQFPAVIPDGAGGFIHKPESW